MTPCTWREWDALCREPPRPSTSAERNAARRELAGEGIRRAIERRVLAMPVPDAAARKVVEAVVAIVRETR